MLRRNIVGSQCLFITTFMPAWFTSEEHSHNLRSRNVNKQPFSDAKKMIRQTQSRYPYIELVYK